MCVSYICLLHLNSEGHFRVRGRYGGDIHVSREFDVALYAIAVDNAALTLSVVGNPYFKVLQSIKYIHKGLLTLLLIFQEKSHDEKHVRESFFFFT